MEPKPAGRLRLLAVGDSLTFGLVSYPDGVMTRVRAGLRAACPGRDLDLLNLGVVGAGVGDYRALVALGLPRFTPDIVLVAFYAGNDGPDLYRHVHDRSPVERLLRHSYLWTFVKNVVKARRGLADHRLADRARQGPAGGGGTGPPRGGAPVDRGAGLAADDPALVGPVMAEGAYLATLADELGHLYRPRDPDALADAWRPVLADLDAIRDAVAGAHARLVLVLLPSALQVDDGLRAELLGRLRAEPRYRDLSAAHVDPRLPDAVLEDWARATGVAYLDATPALIAARHESPGPLYKRRDTHWTVAGNQVAARALVPRLAALVCGG